MRSWPIRRKLFAIPMLAVVLVTVTVLGVLESSRHYESTIRTAVIDAFADLSPTLAPGHREGLRVAQAATARALDQADRSFRQDRLWLISSLGAAILAILGLAWATADALAKRIARLREQLAQLLDRGAPLAPEDAAGDEI